MFAPGLMRFGSTCAGVVLYTMLIHQISCVTTNTAVSLFSESLLWFSRVNSFSSNEFSHELHGFFFPLIYIFLTGDCHDSVERKDRCVTGAIYNYTTQLISGYLDSISVAKRKLSINGYYIFRFHNINFPILNGNNMVRFLLWIIANLTEALMFLSHFIGDVHQVCTSYWDLITCTWLETTFAHWRNWKTHCNSLFFHVPFSCDSLYMLVSLEMKVGTQ